MDTKITLKFWEFYKLGGACYINGWNADPNKADYGNHGNNISVNLADTFWVSDSRLRVVATSSRYEPLCDSPSIYLSTTEYFLWGHRSMYSKYNRWNGGFWKSPYNDGWRTPRKYIEAMMKAAQVEREYGGG